MNVYENKYFRVEVGYPTTTRAVPNPRVCYLIYNKETGVEEYCHTVLYVVKDWVTTLTKLMDTPVEDETKPTASPTIDLFN
jgi:hypothetical protein